MNDVFWGPTSFSMQAYSHLDMQAAVNVFPNKNHKTKHFFFPFHERVGKNRPVTSLVYWRWTDTLTSHLLSWSVQMHFASFILESIFIPQSQMVSQMRGIRSFAFTRNLMFEKGFSIRVSRGPNNRKKENQRNLQLKETLPNESRVNVPLALSITLNEKGHLHYCCKQILPTMLWIPGLNFEEEPAAWGRWVKQKLL